MGNQILHSQLFTIQSHLSKMSASGSGSDDFSHSDDFKTIIKAEDFEFNQPENSILLTTLMVLFTAVTFGLFVTICYVCFKHKWIRHIRNRLDRTCGSLNLNTGRFSLNRVRENIEMTSSRMPLDL